MSRVTHPGRVPTISSFPKTGLPTSFSDPPSGGATGVGRRINQLRGSSNDRIELSRLRRTAPAVRRTVDREVRQSFLPPPLGDTLLVSLVSDCAPSCKGPQRLQDSNSNGISSLAATLRDGTHIDSFKEVAVLGPHCAIPPESHTNPP